MKFNYNGTTYRIRFQYDKGTDSLGKQVTITTAVVEQHLDDNTDLIVTSGAAKQCSLDVFDKAKGRKLALTRALSGTDKHYRTLVWKAYHTRPGGVLSQTAAATES